jgi:hypothetical protein
MFSIFCLQYILNTLQMVSSQKKGKTIHHEDSEMINHVNNQCKQAVEKSLILPICLANERTENSCGVSVEQWNKLDRTAETEIMPYIFDKINMSPPHNIHPHCHGQSFFPE